MAMGGLAYAATEPPPRGPNGELPGLVLVLHGSGDNELGLLNFGVSKQAPLISVYPSALFLHFRTLFLTPVT